MRIDYFDKNGKRTNTTCEYVSFFNDTLMGYHLIAKDILNNVAEIIPLSNVLSLEDESWG